MQISARARLALARRLIDGVDSAWLGSGSARLDTCWAASPASSARGDSSNRQRNVGISFAALKRGGASCGISHFGAGSSRALIQCDSGRALVPGTAERVPLRAREARALGGRKLSLHRLRRRPEASSSAVRGQHRSDRRRCSRPGLLQPPLPAPAAMGERVRGVRAIASAPKRRGRFAHRAADRPKLARANSPATVSGLTARAKRARARTSTEPSFAWVMEQR